MQRCTKFEFHSSSNNNLLRIWYPLLVFLTGLPGNHFHFSLHVQNVMACNHNLRNPDSMPILTYSYFTL